MAEQAGGVLGPALGGALVAGWSATPALVVDAVSFLVSASVLLALPSGAAAASAPEDETASSLAGGSESAFREVLRPGRLLQIVVVVSLLGNLAYTGTEEVALPALVHERFGAADYGGAVGVGAGLAVFSVAAGWQNIVAVTMLQSWTPNAVLGRVMSVVMLAATGTFPISVAVAGFVVRQIGPAPFFPVAGTMIAVAVLAALSQRAFRDYRTGETYRRVTAPETSPAALPADS